MFKLKLPTDPRWVNIVETNILEILADHAWCEQKAASNAISLIVRYPEYTDMVKVLCDIAREEMEHFRMVVEKMEQRGWTLGFDRKDDYVNRIYQFQRKGGTRNQRMVDHLLFAAMIEARSCERFKVLSENIKDNDLAAFYRELMISEANHYTTFINFARQYATDDDVEKRWEDYLEFEAEVIAQYGKKETVHG
ncbi:MAG TPA: tRNA-(ms[2]io[6]A)-hydroxylase [Bacteroidia bacterium]|nr:tRNA-(ms[2]io[6]A)-hydroxylase [Bacteroidia bacterium]MBP7715119.1 tRNA-(ms[2]io[6]A)-hydroxylase [Bacteroidia bacterium]MBP8669576.1 tRNA-(ms[2]io[6]A)-hydroxylase [Bacteroidia bacterium]HOZ83351.1 tRNA-(ms[2]io[6]A)-hydroxylase [Bacteroidia bacterium]HQW17936.1 tRNA-(ms[2]io[6]A)-hydroxylase [Bacteroidia bacterium]